MSVALLFLLPALFSAGSSGASERCSVPDRWNAAIRALPSRYKATRRVQPCFLTGDFDGDHSVDLAITVKHTASGKAGIAVWHSGEHAWHVVGAGHKLPPDGDDDFSWLDAWSVYPRKENVEPGVGEEGEPPKLRGDAILAEKQEAASGLIFWTGKSYRWYQQGD